MTLKLKILIAIIFCANISFGQKTEVLQLNKQLYFKEYNTFSNDSVCTLVQAVCYDAPDVDDEEHCNVLTIIIKDSAKFKKLKSFDLIKNKLLVNCRYKRESMWNLKYKKTKITGHINLVSWSSDSIVLNLDIVVLDIEADQTYIYKGDRTFLNPVSANKK